MLHIKGEERGIRATTTLALDQELWKATKHQAIDEERSPGYIVEDALRAYLEQHAKKAEMIGHNRRKAFPYSQFSTKDQASGSSKRRQDRMVRDWIARHPEFELDSSLNLHDAGVSAYRARIRKKGAMGRFLEAIKQGLVKRGDALLVENWDRFSRETPYDAEPVLRVIFSAGITIVNLEKDDAYNEEILRKHPEKYEEILKDIRRAHEESARKGRLIAGAWEDKRDKIADGERVRQWPQPWLYWCEEDGEYKVHEHVADAVKRVFDMKAAGKGSVEIARILDANSSVWRPQRKGFWYREYIDQLVRNRIVLGEHRSRERGKPKDSAVVRYYPQIITEATFNSAHTVISTNAKLAGHGGGANKRIHNLFAEIARCRCGATMQFEHKRTPYLLCSTAYGGGACDGKRVSYDRLETLLLHLCRWRGFDPKDLDNVVETSAGKLKNAWMRQTSS